MTPYPVSVDAIDAVWFSACLAQGYPGTEVTALRRGTYISGTATKVEYHLDYNAVGQAHGLPPSLWLKCGLETQIAEQAAHSTIEACFFRDLAPALPVNLPRPYGTQIAPDGSSGIVIYEDLNPRPVRFGNQATAIAHAGMLDILDLLAALHASHWHDPGLQALGWLTPGGVIHSNQVIDRFIGFWDYAAARPRFEHVPERLRDRERIRRAIHRMLDADMADPVCVVHGDPHQGNLFFDPDGRPGLVDWATVMHGHWAWDVAYAMIGAQPVAQRRAHHDAQLAHYLARLEAHGVAAPGIEAARRAVARHAIWIFLFALCPAELQPEALCVMSAERACAAITDLDTLRLIEDDG